MTDHGAEGTDMEATLRRFRWAVVALWAVAAALAVVLVAALVMRLAGTF